ncbi:hypothetical protein R5H30_13865 [Sulfitobacter sp. D35]|uniref:hypothetical protein n=1 Tax=Sulfitobacter sp. D35 TaxID=3083252 RepID=UPI00296ED26F|nr:hypothetical protein [Sulfitobacter sp. D35]MDW4499078.1 hypothetical protein [Sulfitobacter sp. D35]
MPVLLILLLVGVLAYLYWRHTRTTLTRDCRWRADRSRDKGSLHFHRCASCGAEVYTAGDGAPRDCRRGTLGGRR